METWASFVHVQGILLDKFVSISCCAQQNLQNLIADGMNNPCLRRKVFPQILSPLCVVSDLLSLLLEKSLTREYSLFRVDI